MKLHLFKLNRKLDVHGNSGTGFVAHGVVVPSGKVIMWWNTPISSITVYDSLTNVEDLHGHEGATDIKEITSPAEILELFGLDPKELLKKRRKKSGPA